MWREPLGGNRTTVHWTVRKHALGTITGRVSHAGPLRASDQLNTTILRASDQLNTTILRASDQLNTTILRASDLAKVTGSHACTDGWSLRWYVRLYWTGPLPPRRETEAALFGDPLRSRRRSRISRPDPISAKVGRILMTSFLVLITSLVEMASDCGASGSRSNVWDLVDEFARCCQTAGRMSCWRSNKMHTYCQGWNSHLRPGGESFRPPSGLSSIAAHFLCCIGVRTSFPHTLWKF